MRQQILRTMKQGGGVKRGWKWPDGGHLLFSENISIVV